MKPTRLPTTRRTNDGKKSAPKKPKVSKIKVNKSAFRKGLNDQFWQIGITISNSAGLELISMILHPQPPGPPVSPSRLGNLIRNALRSLPRANLEIG